MTVDVSANRPWSSAFQNLGGHFVTAPGPLQKKLARIRALIFDWDGVFNAGQKGEQTTSHFTEPDSMGSNMLRFGLWLPQGSMPVVAVITGVDNRSALHLARREHFHDVYFSIRNKGLAVAHICSAHGIRPEQVACLFDDINDLEMAQACGVRCLVARKASPMFTRYVVQRGLTDYVTGCGPHRHGVREFCELALAALERYDQVIAARMSWNAQYQAYFTQRQAILTNFYTQKADQIRPAANVS
jgi:3-deoxy-D-manno-octulosonate 8-phosphate phosphatase (KDO 8-P phosphatase)